MHSAAFVFGIVFAFVVGVISQDVTFQCQNGKFGPTPAIRAKLGACTNSTEYGTEEGKKDPKCAAYCFTEAITQLKDGLPDREAFEKMIETEFPEAQKKVAKEQLGFCFEKHGSSIDAKDEKCVGIAAFSACATSLVTKTECPAA